MSEDKIGRNAEIVAAFDAGDMRIAIAERYGWSVTMIGTILAAARKTAPGSVRYAHLNRTGCNVRIASGRRAAKRRGNWRRSTA